MEPSGVFYGLCVAWLSKFCNECPFYKTCNNTNKLEEVIGGKDKR